MKKLEKIWINRANKEHNFIVFNDNILYRLKANKDNFNAIEHELNAGIINDKFIGLPLAYISRIEFVDNDKNLKAHYIRDAVDEIEISDAVLRKEIFDFFKDSMPAENYTIVDPPNFEKIKQPVMGLVVVLVLFAIMAYIFNDWNIINGAEDEIGSRILAIGISLLICIPFALFAIYRINKDYENSREIHRLFYKPKARIKESYMSNTFDI